MKKTGFFFLVGMLLTMACFGQSAAPLAGTTVTVQSPDSKLAAKFYQVKNSEGNNTMFYEVTYKGTQVIRPSMLDIRLDNHLSENAMALKVDTLTRWTSNLLVRN